MSALKVSRHSYVYDDIIFVRAMMQGEMKKYPLEIVTTRIKAEQRRRIVELGESFGLSTSLVLRKVIDEGLKRCRRELKFSRGDEKR